LQNLKTHSFVCASETLCPGAGKLVMCYYTPFATFAITGLILIYCDTIVLLK
jgi:hypothetical protein